MSQPEPKRRLRVTLGSDVVMQIITWWEEFWIALGALTLLAGREGLGKSTIACHWAARETLAGNFILYIHSEDSREHTVAPRLKAAGADMSKVIFVDVETEFTENGSVVLPYDTDEVDALIAEYGITFIVLDAATSAMSSHLSGKDDRQVRQYLEPLSKLAAKHNIVILGLVHFGKRDGADSGKLILGSIAWSQVARSVLSVALDPDSGNLVVTNTKGNLAPRTRSVEARIVSTAIAIGGEQTEIGVLEWLGETTSDARDFLAGEEGQGNRDVDDWLNAYLDPTPQKANDIFQAADANGFSKDQVKRAKKRIGALAERPDNPGPWFWRLPTVVDGEVSDVREQGAGGTEQGVDVLPVLSALPVRSEGVEQGAEGGQGAESTHDPLLAPSSHISNSSVRNTGNVVSLCKRCSVVLSPGNDTTLCAECRLIAQTPPLHIVQEQGKVTCAAWFGDHIQSLIDGGNETAESGAVYEAGQAAGWKIDNLRRASSESPLISTVSRGPHGATWRLGAGGVDAISCPTWLHRWLREQGDWTPAADAFAAGATAGYGRTTVKAAAKRICVLKRGASVATQWQANPDYESKSA